MKSIQIRSAHREVSKPLLNKFKSASETIMRSLKSSTFKVAMMVSVPLVLSSACTEIYLYARDKDNNNNNVDNSVVIGDLNFDRPSKPKLDDGTCDGEVYGVFAVETSDGTAYGSVRDNGTIRYNGKSYVVTVNEDSSVTVADSSDSTGLEPGDTINLTGADSSSVSLTFKGVGDTLSTNAVELQCESVNDSSVDATTLMISWEGDLSESCGINLDVDGVFCGGEVCYIDAYVDGELNQISLDDSRTIDSVNVDPVSVGTSAVKAVIAVNGDAEAYNIGQTIDLAEGYKMSVIESDGSSARITVYKDGSTIIDKVFKKGQREVVKTSSGILVISLEALKNYCDL